MKLRSYIFTTNIILILLLKSQVQTASLKALNLGHNRIGDLGIQKLKSGLIKNKSLHKLGFLNTKLGSEGEGNFDFLKMWDVLHLHISRFIMLYHALPSKLDLMNDDEDDDDDDDDQMRYVSKQCSHIKKISFLPKMIVVDIN